MFVRHACGFLLLGCISCFGLSATPAESAEISSGQTTTARKEAAVAAFTAAGVHPTRKGSLTFLRWRGEPLGELSQLHLYTAGVHNETLADVALFPELRLLELRETSVTDEGLKQLQYLPHLEHLALLPINRYQKSNIRIQWSYPTIPMPAQRQKITSAGLQALRFCPQLKQVDLVDSQVTADGLSALEVLPKLQSLSLSFPLDEQAVFHLKRLPKVTHLELVGQAVTADSLRMLTQLPQIKSLAIAGTPLAPAALTVIAQQKQLQKLALVDCQLDDASLAALAGLTMLESLSVARNPIQGPGLAKLKSCTKLTTLLMDFTDISDDQLHHLTQLPAVELLSLSYDLQVTNAGIQAGVLQQMPALRQLRLRGLTQINDELLETFIDMKQLKGLVVRSTPFSHEATEKLRARRPDLDILK